MVVRDERYTDRSAAPSMDDISARALATGDLRRATAALVDATRVVVQQRRPIDDTVEFIALRAALEVRDAADLAARQRGSAGL